MKKNKIWIPITAVVLSLAAIAAMLLVPMIPKAEAAVYPVTMVGYTDYYGSVTESYGMVTTDKVQTLYISATQTVTEILVYPGQEVKKGDVLFTYDTTLSDLAVERKDLANQQLEVQLKTAQAELAALKKMKPIVYKPSTNTSTTKTNYTKSPADASKLNQVYSTGTSGLSSSTPLYVWIASSKQVDDAMIEYLFSQAPKAKNYVYVVFQMSPLNQADKEFSSHIGIRFTRTTVAAPADPSEPIETTPPTAAPTTPPAETVPPTTAPTEPPVTTVPAETTETTAPTETTENTEPAESTEPSQEPEESSVPVGEPTPAPAETVSYTMTFFTPPSAPKEDNDTVEWNDGYTSAELTTMKSEKQAEITQLQFDIKMGKAELNIMKKEASDGKVIAAFDGIVTEILEPLEALESGQPLMKVIGGGGYYVEGTVSELALDTVRLGQTVTVNAWDTGMVYTGRVVEIGSYPTEDQGYYYGADNVSYYPYKVFIDESADLQEGYYVSMSVQTEEQTAGILYLQNAFLRSEGNRTYVYVRGAEGTLEKRYLECGVSTDGYMTPIYSGITEEDYLAVPYGKEIVEGAPTYEGTDQDLYGY